MGSLREQLARAGLVSHQEVGQAEAMDRFHEEEAARESIRVAAEDQRESLEDLEMEMNIREFRARARKLLIERPDLIRDVIRLAHRFKDQEGGKRLLWQVFSVRETLAKVPGPKRERFLRRAFRAHGATVEVPEE